MGRSWCQYRWLYGRFRHIWTRSCVVCDYPVPVHFYCTVTHRAFSKPSQSNNVVEWSKDLKLSEPELDWDWICHPNNYAAIKENIVNRKGVGDIDTVLDLRKQYLEATNEITKKELWMNLLREAVDLPNQTHCNVPIGDESSAVVVDTVGQKKDFTVPPCGMVEIGHRLGLLRTDDISLSTGPRTYYFIGSLANLENALIRYTLSMLIRKKFSLISVPDLLRPAIIESCGFKTTGERSQVYKLDAERHGQVCLAGTSELALAGFFRGRTLNNSHLPQRHVAVSRCYRAETSEVEREKGIYRVHQFTKVEMFGVTTNDTGLESSNLLAEFIDIEKEIFTELGLHFRILEMPSQELGAPAYRKYDIEAWMSEKEFWGEISSASNCTDFQSRRLSIKYKNETGAVRHVHTINGTACAVPRMLMAICEHYQTKDRKVEIPEVLRPYMGDMHYISLQPDNHRHKMTYLINKKYLPKTNVKDNVRKKR